MMRCARPGSRSLSSTKPSFTISAVCFAPEFVAESVFAGPRFAEFRTTGAFRHLCAAGAVCNFFCAMSSGGSGASLGLTVSQGSESITDAAETQVFACLKEGTESFEDIMDALKKGFGKSELPEATKPANFKTEALSPPQEP